MNSAQCVDRYNELGAKNADKFVVLQQVFMEMFKISQEEMQHAETYNQQINVLKKYDQIWKAFCYKVAEDIHKNLYRVFVKEHLLKMPVNPYETNVLTLCLQNLGWM